MDDPQDTSYEEADNYGSNYQGPELPDYDEDLDESFIGLGGALYEGEDLDYEDHWDNYEEEELYDQIEQEEMLSISDGRGNSPGDVPTSQPLVTGVSDSIHQYGCQGGSL